MTVLRTEDGPVWATSNPACSVPRRVIRCRLAVAVAVIVAAPALWSAPAFAEELPDQEQLLSSNAHASGPGLAQTFTADTAGSLTRVKLLLTSTASSDHTVQIRTVDATGPTATVLASETVPVGITAAPAWIEVPFSSAAEVSQGTQYALVLLRNGPGVSLTWHGQGLPDPYPAGDAWWCVVEGSCSDMGAWSIPAPSTPFDFAFQTFVTPAPTGNPTEPAAILEAIQAMITSSDSSSWQNQGVRTAFSSRIDDIGELVDDQAWFEATRAAFDLRRTVDGCGPVPDRNDWFEDCGEQGTLRTLLDDLLARLGAL